MADCPILIPMKRFITLLIILFSLADINAQRNLQEARPVWFGVNMGGTWQTSDMKPLGGIGWGFTVSRYSRVSSPSPLYWGWRFRFLDGRNYGYNYHGLTGVNNNPVLSSGTTNYSSGLDPDTAFIYSNYKMRFDEFAGELIIGSNTLRKHGVLVYGFGGVGMTYWKTMTDQLDLSGNKYDYSTITNNGDMSAVEAQLDAMWDKEYETAANGSQNGGQWGFMPSAGFGFGYQWSNFSIAMEHRTTWSLGDIIDGTTHSSAGPGTENGNDLYHYDGLSFKWNFHSKKDDNHNNVPPPPPPPNPNAYNTPPPNNNTQTVPNTNSNPTPNNNQTPANPNLPIQPPTVSFTNPSVDPYNAVVVNQSLVVRVTNVATKSQISLTINNVVSTDYNWNPTTNTMTFNHTLIPGNNTYRVVATNQAGSAQDVQTIIYKTGNEPTTGPPPTVTITTPSTDPYTSTTPTYNVIATVNNVAGSNDIKITKNGQPVTIFNYNAQTKICMFTANLMNGSNTYVITGTNNYGTATDQVTINYGVVSTTPPPVVTITNPNACPFQTKTQNHTLTASVTNVSAASQVSVVFNNQTVTNFTYTQHGANATVSFPVSLVSGNNPFTVSATNSVGSDSKACMIVYKPSGPAVVPPTVNFTYPATTPHTVTSSQQTFTATVMNVDQQSQITVVKAPNTSVPFSFNPTTHVVTFTQNLTLGSTQFTVTGTNTAGTASDNVTVNYNTTTPGNGGSSTIGGGSSNAPGGNTPGNGGSSTIGGGSPTVGSGGDQGRPDPTPPTGPPPTIDLHVPSSSPVTIGATTLNVVMIVNNVTSTSQITVKVNQVVQTSGISYNATTHQLAFTATLVSGQNGIQVIATNPYGTAQRGLVVNCNATNRLQEEPSKGSSPEPKKEEPKKAEPKAAEPKKEDPKPAAEPKTEPKKEEPKKADPKPATPRAAEPKKEDPKPAPAPAAPAPAPRPR